MFCAILHRCTETEQETNKEISNQIRKDRNTQTLLKVWGWGEFKGEKCTCPLATCEKLYRGASSPSLVFIKCVKAKRLLNGNALKQIGLTGSNCPRSRSQERTDGSCPCLIRVLISLYQAEYN